MPRSPQNLNHLARRRSHAPASGLGCKCRALPFLFRHPSVVQAFQAAAACMRFQNPSAVPCAMRPLMSLTLAPLMTMPRHLLIVCSCPRPLPTFPSPCTQAKHWLQAISFICQTFLLMKLVGVAVAAPDDAWPHHSAHPGGKKKSDDAAPPFVGLACMFISIGSSLMATYLQIWLAGSTLKAWRAKEAAGPGGAAAAGGLEQPLLPAPAAAAAGDQAAAGKSGDGGTVSAARPEGLTAMGPFGKLPGTCLGLACCNLPGRA